MHLFTKFCETGQVAFFFKKNNPANKQTNASENIISLVEVTVNEIIGPRLGKNSFCRNANEVWTTFYAKHQSIICTQYSSIQTFTDIDNYWLRYRFRHVVTVSDNLPRRTQSRSCCDLSPWMQAANHLRTTPPSDNWQFKPQRWLYSPIKHWMQNDVLQNRKSLVQFPPTPSKNMIL